MDCHCQPCPVHDSIPEQEFRNANAKRAGYEREERRRLGHEVVRGDAPIRAHEEPVGLHE
jgi:hypothetical protein